MRNRPLCSVCLLWIFLIAGIVWFGGEKAEDFFSPSDLETCVEDREEVLVSGTVWKKEFTENRQTYYLTNVSIHIHGRSLRESKIILYRKTNSKKQTENEIFCGNKVKVTGKLRYFDRARNPGNFDQRAYYRRQKIHASVWIDKVLKNRGKREQWRERIWRLREHWKEMLIRQLGKEKGGVLTAMLLGDRSAMDPEIKELYQVNGIAHILAISGVKTLKLDIPLVPETRINRAFVPLHIAIIYILKLCLDVEIIPRCRFPCSRGYLTKCINWQKKQ